MSTEVASGAVSDVSVSCDGWPRAETLSIRRVGRDDRRRPFDADSVLGHRPPAAIALDADGACDVCNGGVKHHSRCMALTLLILSSQPAEIKKYSTYHVNVDPDQDDKATEIKLLSFKRPHMRAFHCSWMGFFTVRQRLLLLNVHHLGVSPYLDFLEQAFFIWFAIAPLLPEIKNTLGLTKQQVWTSNICSVAGTIFM